MAKEFLVAKFIFFFKGRESFQVPINKKKMGYIQAKKEIECDHFKIIIKLGLKYELHLQINAPFLRDGQGGYLKNQQLLSSIILEFDRVPAGYLDPRWTSM